MTDQEQNLSTEQKELVAVGASVGAGCQPCLSHHLNVGAQAGLGGEQRLAAVVSAERVSAEAAVAIGDHTRATLGTDVSSPALLSRLEEALASLGAALGANDATNIERQLRAAADLGASRAQLQQAIDTAHTVQENAARIHLREAERLLDTAATTVTAKTDSQHEEGCGCGASNETQEAPVTAQESEPTTAVTGNGSGEGCGCGADDQRKDESVTAAEPVAASSGHTAGCGEMATQFAAGAAFAPMASCREMFERFMPAAAAETDKAPAAMSATGACKKEA